MSPAEAIVTLDGILRKRVPQDEWPEAWAALSAIENAVNATYDAGLRYEYVGNGDYIVEADQ